MIAPSTLKIDQYKDKFIGDDQKYNIVTAYIESTGEFISGVDRQVGPSGSVIQYFYTLVPYRPRTLRAIHRCLALIVEYR